MKKQGTFLGMPYDWRLPTPERFKKRIWNKKEHRLFTPKTFGWGYTINLYELLHNRKKFLFFIILLFALLGFFTFKQIKLLHEAHSTFNNYYAFRGCTKLLKRTDTYGICKTYQEQIIKIIKYNNKWYLDGDLPCGFLCF